eukprot:TRINITY_DN841_c0_g2_i1.p1 TRINITY_DN841_c0_g2~~TRINITY_DN841_c0_g2_i1.p1  ORF type:complete len:301 (-),score=15.42 TRINITY_DN841_c0_g2_i1:53-880(-)
MEDTEFGTFVRQHVLSVFVVFSFIHFFVHILVKHGLRQFALRVLHLTNKNLAKFAEHTFTFLYYTITFIVACYVCYHKKWLWNISYCWLEYPYHIDEDVLWYFLFQGSFYFAALIQLLTSGWNEKIMITHHIVTLLLIGLSYISGHTRVGMLVFMVHDCSDIFMELAKVALYTKADRIKNVCFVIFAVVFFISRLIVYPFHIIKSVLLESAPTAHLTPYGGMKLYYIFLALLISLQIMHIYWMFLICRMILRFLREDMDVKKDIRSDDDENLKED